MNRLLLVSALFLPAFSWAQYGPKIEYHGDFTGGLNTRLSPSQINDNESQDLQNVYLDEKGIQQRGGSVKRNLTALADGVHDVSGLYEYLQSDGDEYCVAFSSTTGYYSTDKCVSFTAFISTLTAGQDVNCTPFQDRLYCQDGTDAAFYFDGTNDVPAGNMPICKGMQVHQTRLWCYGVAGHLSRIYFSNVNDGLTWDTTFNWSDFNPEDGDTIQGIGVPIFDTLPVYKKYSTWIIQGRQADDYTPVQVNSTIGAKSHRAIANLLIGGKTLQLFDSPGPKGSEPGIYTFNGVVVGYASSKIRDTLRNLPNFRDSAKFKQWTSQTDWDTGTLNYISSTIDVGTIQNSTWGVVDTSSADFAAGTFDHVNSTETSGSLVSMPIGMVDDFTDGNYTAGPVWTAPGGSWEVTDGYLTGSSGDSSYIYTNIGMTVALGLLRIHLHHKSPNVTTASQESIMAVCAGSNGNCLGTTDGIQLAIRHYLTPEHSVILTVDGVTVASGTIIANTNWHEYEVRRDNNHNYFLYYDGTFISQGIAATVTTAGSIFLRDAGSLGRTQYYDDIVVAKVGAGTFISQTSDTFLSTPTWGLFNVTMSSSANATLTFQTQTSTASDGVWDSLVTATPGAKISSAQKEFIRYKLSFGTPTSTSTAQLNDVTLSATSTGTWTSAETYLSNDLGTWGLCQSVEDNTGASPAWIYEMRVATYSGGTNAASWSTITKNALLTISTGAYIQIRPTNSLAIATDTAKIDSLTINYNEGSPAKSSEAEIYKGRYYWFGQSAGGTHNDLTYVLDSNAAWTRLTGLNVRSAAIVQGNLFTGDSMTSSSGFVRQQDTGIADDGTAVNAYWQSKDFLFSTDELMKTVSDVYMSYVGSSTVLTASLYGDGSLVGTYSVNLTTSQPMGIKRWHVVTAKGGDRAGYHSLKFSHNLTDAGFTLLGFRFYWQPAGWREP